MHSLRRAALRSALSASKAACPRTTSAAPLAIRAAAEWNVTRTRLPQAIRFFSQTPRRATDKDLEEEQRKTEEDLENQVAVDARQDVEESVAQTEADIQEAMQEVSASGEEPQQERRVRRGQDNIETTVFVRNLVFEVTEEHLQQAFSKYGEIASTFVARDPRVLSKGYGFVEFKAKEAVDEACAQVNGSFWHGRRVTCIPRAPRDRPARPDRQAQGPKEPTAQLFIGNIPYETTDAELNRIFHNIDNLLDVRVAVDRTTGWPRGFAHADFASVEAATVAKNRLQGAMLGDRTLRFDFAHGYQRQRGRLSSRGDNNAEGQE